MVIKLKYSNRTFDLYMRLSYKTNHILEQDKMQGKERGDGYIYVPSGSFNYSREGCKVK